MNVWFQRGSSVDAKALVRRFDFSLKTSCTSRDEDQSYKDILSRVHLPFVREEEEFGVRIPEGPVGSRREVETPYNRGRELLGGRVVPQLDLNSAPGRVEGVRGSGRGDCHGRPVPAHLTAASSAASAAATTTAAADTAGPYGTAGP